MEALVEGIGFFLGEDTSQLLVGVEVAHYELVVVGAPVERYVLDVGVVDL